MELPRLGGELEQIGTAEFGNRPGDVDAAHGDVGERLQPFAVAAPTEHGSVADDGAGEFVERVESGADHAAHVGRQIVGVGAVRCCERAGHLFEEQGIAACSFDESGPRCRIKRAGNLGCEEAHRVLVEAVEGHAEQGEAPGGRRPAFEQLRHAGHHHHDWPATEPIDEMLEQGEDGVIGELEIGEPDHQRGGPREHAEQDASAPDDLGDHSIGREPGQMRVVPEDVHDAVGDTRRIEQLRPIAESAFDHLRNRRAGIVGLGRLVERNRRPDQAGDRPPDVGLAVGQTPTVEDDGVMVEAGQVGDLAGDTRLAHPRFSGDAEQQTAAGLVGIGDRKRDEIELSFAPDEGQLGTRPSFAGTAVRSERPVRGDRRLSPACMQLTDRPVADELLGGLVSDGTDEDCARLGCGLEPRRRIHDVAHRRVVVAGRHCADEHLAGVDPDAEPDADTVVDIETTDGLLHAQRRTHRPLGVVLMGDRRTEQGHDRIANDLVDPSTERGDVVGESGETAVDQVLDLFGIAVLREAGEPDDVGEEHGDNASLVGPSGEFVAARAAEPGAIDDLGLTSGTLHHPNLRGKPTSASVVSTGRNDDPTRHPSR